MGGTKILQPHLWLNAAEILHPPLWPHDTKILQPFLWLRAAEILHPPQILKLKKS